MLTHVYIQARSLEALSVETDGEKIVGIERHFSPEEWSAKIGMGEVIAPFMNLGNAYTIEEIRHVRSLQQTGILCNEDQVVLQSIAKQLEAEDGWKITYLKDL